MEIRKLTINDAPAYYDLRIEALRDSPDAFSTQLKDALQRPVEKTAENLALENAVTFGAFKAGKLLGNLTLVRNTAPKLNHRASVVAVYVTPDERGHGLAGRLMQELLQFATNWQGLERLDLMVASENLPAIALYEQCGFEKYGTEVWSMKTPEKYIDENLMVKFI
ncbi:N-acetyltransferase GCN5 [Planococcus antarcticus DSM 14505]|uniref:GNAT family N-acetyltransferase n=1 Tax=Planococcus antarcticus DSM 14505 TaxID=1185653 RepID=A0A1C7DGR0_9BACL|nr:GNAT family N-acetyltransferase [Planococcus antarcticus]ANU10749.1 GNAT family N-acetyltransferase [Planococcus antarcticus DSM 14505]EIM06845.1 N-acetyltransferase GCN5 [Planococcus antarcticus DSM 14505]